jgi:hypothetical protein
MMPAFIAQGALYLLADDGSLKPVESAFALKHELEAEKRRATSPWQSQPEGGGLWGGFSIWGDRGMSGVADKYLFNEVARGPGATLFYGMSSGAVAGLFAYDTETGEERRIFHKNGFQFEGLDYCPASKRFIIGRPREDGASDLELLSEIGHSEKMVTGGDSVDSHPRFSMRDTNTVVFQSSGIARNEAGIAVMRGPASINRVDLESGDMTEVIAGETFDYLLPKEDSEGVVYCIRRPYAVSTMKGAGAALLDFLLLPFRFFHALYLFFKTFSAIYGSQPKLAGGPQPDVSKEQQYVRVLDRMIDVGKARKGRRGEEPSLVPRTWELVRIPPGGEPEVVANAVCAFDLDEEGALFVTNGFAVHRMHGGRASALGKSEVIQRLRC